MSDGGRQNISLEGRKRDSLFEGKDHSFQFVSRSWSDLFIRTISSKYEH